MHGVVSLYSPLLSVVRSDGVLNYHGSIHEKIHCQSYVCGGICRV